MPHRRRRRNAPPSTAPTVPTPPAPVPPLLVPCVLYIKGVYRNDEDPNDLAKLAPDLGIDSSSSRQSTEPVRRRSRYWVVFAKDGNVARAWPITSIGSTQQDKVAKLSHIPLAHRTRLLALDPVSQAALQTFHPAFPSPELTLQNTTADPAPAPLTGFLVPNVAGEFLLSKLEHDLDKSFALPPAQVDVVHGYLAYMDVYTQEVLWASTRGMRGGVAGGTGGNGNGNSSGSEGRTGGKGGEAHDEDDEDSEEEDTEEEFLYLASFWGSMAEGFRQAAATVRKKKLAAQAVQHANQQAEAQKRVLDYVKNQASRSDPGYESSEHEGSE